MLLFYYLQLIYITKALEFTYFSTPTFNDLEGWSIKCNLNSGNFIGTYNSLSYAGLGYLKSAASSDALYKVFYQLPPHYAVRISGQFYIFSQKNIRFGWYQILVYADQNLSDVYKIFNQNDVFVEKIVTLDVETSHSSDSIIIRISLYTTAPIDSALGVRDLKIKFQECPAGCLKCEFGDNLGQCTLWKKLDCSLSEINIWSFNNDGWYVDSASSNSIFTCNDYQNFNFFGLFNENTKIQKTFTLPPHYQIKFEVLALYVQTDFIRGPSLIFELDNQIIFTQDNSYNNSLPNLCNFVYIPSNIYGDTDIINRVVTDKFLHNLEKISLKLYINQKYLLQGLWGIRDFIIYLKKCHSICISSCNGPSETDCIIEQVVETDFYSAFTTNTILDQDGWQIASPYNLMTICNGYQILGGYQKLQGQNILYYAMYDLQDHSSISLSLQFYYIENLLQDKFSIFINDVNVYEYSIQPQTNSEDCCNFCGGDDLDLIQLIDLKNIQHSSSFLILSFTTSQMTSVSYWGIRSIVIKLENFVIKKSIFENKQNDPTGWYFSSKSILTTKCNKGSFNFIGYFQSDQIFRRIFSNLSQHQTLHISFKIIIQYSIITEDKSKIWLQADGTQIWSSNFLFSFNVKACDDDINYSVVFLFEVFYQHSNSEILLEFLSDFKIDKFWGIREFKIKYL